MASKAIPRPLSDRRSRPVRAHPVVPIGREQESALLLRLAEDAGVRVITVTGISGSGKSLLAADVARTLELRPTWQAATVHLSWVTGSAAAIRLIAHALARMPSTPDPDAGRGALLVLDGAHCLEGQGGYLRGLVAARPELTLLATSTAPLRVPGEQLVRLDPLPAPAPDTLSSAELTGIGAVRMFVRCWERSGRSVADGDLPLIAALCHRVGGLPLAVDMAASAAVRWGLAGVLARLDHGDGLAELRRRGAGTARHRSVLDALRFTCDMLAPADRALLDAVAAFHGPFGIDAAAVVAGPADNLGERLATLVDARVLDPIGTLGAEPAFVLPTLIREFEHHRVPAGALDRHADFVAMRCRQAYAAFIAGRQTVALGLLMSVWPEVAPACEHVARRSGPVAALAIAVDAAPHPWAVRLQHAGGDLLARLTEAARQHPALPDGLLARALIWRAILSRDDPAALTAGPGGLDDLARAGLELATAGNDVDTQLLGLEFRSVLPPVPPCHDRSHAQRAAEQGLALATDSADERLQARFLARLGMLADRRGELATARQHCERALRVARRVGDEPTLVMVARQLLAMPPGWGVSHLPTVDELLVAARRGLDNRDLILLLSTASFRAIMSGRYSTGAAWALQAMRMVSDMGATGSSTAAVLVTNALAMAGRREEFDIATRLAGALSPVAENLIAALPWWKRTVLRELLTSLPGTRRSPRESIADATVVAMDYLGRIAAPGATPTVDRRDAPAVPTGPGRPAVLTRRQQDVLAAVASGRSNKEIAALLGITVKTVMHHTMAVYRALGVHRRSEATAWAVRNGLVEP